MDFSRKRKAHLKLGKKGEDLSVKLLQSKGMTILRRNFRTPLGELDIVARDGGTIVFAEVKTLRKIGRFRPIDNYRSHQMRRNIRAAHEYIRIIDAADLPIRFDFIEVVIPKFKTFSIYHYTDFINISKFIRHRH